jgi:hypothetical protein
MSKVRKRVTLRTSELLKAPKPPQLIEGLIAKTGVTGLTADPGVGKTFVAMEIARHVVEGSMLFDRFPVKKGSVLFVGQDCSESEYGQMARKIYAGREHKYNEIEWLFNEGFDLAKTKDMLKLLDIAQRIPDPNFDPDVPTDYTFIPPDDNPDAPPSECTWEPVYGSPYGVSLIILDSLRDMFIGDENSSDTMGRVFGNLRALARGTKAAVVVVHHHSYEGEPGSRRRFRGSTAQEAALSGWIELSGAGERKLARIRKLRGIRVNDFKYLMRSTHDTCRFEYEHEVLSQKDSDPDQISTPRQSYDDVVLEFVHTLSTPTTVADVTKFLVETRGLGGGSARTRSYKVLKSLVEKGHLTANADGTWTT